MEADLLVNPGFWISIFMVTLAWAFGTMLKRAGARREHAGEQSKPRGQRLPAPQERSESAT